MLLAELTPIKANKGKKRIATVIAVTTISKLLLIGRDPNSFPVQYSIEQNRQKTEGQLTRIDDRTLLLSNTKLFVYYRSSHARSCFDCKGRVTTQMKTD